MKNYSPKQILKAIEGSFGTISVVAKRLNCNWNTADTYIHKWPETCQALKDENERLVDAAEMVVIKSLEEGDVQTAKYILSTKGKKRGYTEKVEHTGEGGGPIQHQVAVGMVKQVIDDLNTEEI